MRCETENTFVDANIDIKNISGREWERGEAISLLVRLSFWETLCDFIFVLFLPKNVNMTSPAPSTFSAVTDIS